MRLVRRVSIWQILESATWTALGLGMIKVINDFGQEAWFNNSILLFTMPLPGLLLGLAVGAFFGSRGFSLEAQLGLRLACALVGFLLWLPIVASWGPGAQ